jgi:hypothetical protein
MAPDGAAVKQVPDLASQPLRKCGRGVEGEADQVNNHVGLQVGDPGRERTVPVLGDPVRGDVTYLLPGRVILVAGSLSAADVDHVVAVADQPGNQEGADVAAPPDDDNSHEVRLGACLDGGPDWFSQSWGCCVVSSRVG